MLTIPPSSKVFLCTQPIDMRKGFDGLSGLVETYFGQNPCCGHLFVFFSKTRDRMKVLVWDLDGFVLYYKRLERGTYTWIIEIAKKEGAEIRASDFALVLNGINPVEFKKRSNNSTSSLSINENTLQKKAVLNGTSQMVSLSHEQRRR